MLRNLFLSGLLAAAPGTSLLHGTTVVVLWNPNEIVVAADSKSIWTDRRGDVSGQQCKIRQTGPFFYAVSGLNFEAGTGFDVHRIAEQAARFPGTMSQKVAEFERLVKPSLAKALASIQATTPQLYQTEIAHNRGHALDIVFFGIENDTPFLFVRRFGTTDFSSENHQPAFPSTGHVVLGEQEAITNYIRNNPRWNEAGLVSAANRLIELQIAATPQTVGHPINILVVNRSGGRWAFSPRGCPEISR